MDGELTEANLKKVFDEIGDTTNPDSFLVSKKQLEMLKSNGMVRYDRITCSWELLEERITKPIKEVDK